MAGKYYYNRDPELLKFVAVQAKGSVRVVERWHPHRLRHSAATRIRREHGLEAARVILGHSSAVTSELYAEIDKAKALKVMQEVG